MTAIARRASGVRELLGRYVAECESFWTETTNKRQREKQCGKVRRHVALIEEQFGLSPDQALDQVLEFAHARLIDRPSTVYITGRGGSGSHWLAEMLADLGPFADAGEVPFPARLTRELMSWPLQEQAMFVDCVQLLHAWTGQPYPDQPAKPHPDISSRHVVNSNGDIRPLWAKLLEPQCVFVHLIRDPRDQVLSFTYRKLGAQARYPIEPLEDFLRLMLIFSRVSLVKLLTGPVAPDLVCRYEELRSDASRALREIVSRAGAEVPSEAIDDVASRHSAEERRAGRAPLGNLSRIPHKRWQDTASRTEKLLMHAGLAEVIDTFGYAPDDCAGEPVEFAPLPADFHVELPDAVALGELHVRRDPRSGWERLGDGAGTFTLPAGVMSRLRVPGGWTAEVSRIAELMPDGSLSSLCLAGNTDVTDGQLGPLVGRRGLVELDLARTPVTDACIETIVQITQLRHVSLIGTAVSAAAEERLRRSLLDCQVSSGPMITDSMRGRGFFDETLIVEPPR
jgi:hypothetical protein